MRRTANRHNFCLTHTYPVPSSMLGTFHSFSNTARKCQSWNLTLGLLTLTWMLLKPPPQCQLLTYHCLGEEGAYCRHKSSKEYLLLFFFFQPTSKFCSWAWNIHMACVLVGGLASWKHLSDLESRAKEAEKQKQ